mgnify:CR=1 FL=1
MSLVDIDTFTSYIRDEIGATGKPLTLQALDAAESWVQQFCQRSFTLATGTPTARVFGPLSMEQWYTVLRVDDIATPTGLIVSNYGTTVASTDYQLEPLNGRDATGLAVPYTQIRLLSSSWTTNMMRATATITADWGWASTPALVTQSILQLGKDYVVHRDAKFGFIETSVGAVSGSRNWSVMNMLARFRRTESFGFG